MDFFHWGKHTNMLDVKSPLLCSAICPVSTHKHTNKYLLTNEVHIVKKEVKKPAKSHFYVLSLNKNANIQTYVTLLGVSLSFLGHDQGLTVYRGQGSHCKVS